MKDEAVAAPVGAGAERRTFARRALRNTAFLLLPGGKTLEVRTFDISAGGMGILVDVNPPRGATFSIRVSLPLKIRGYDTFESRVQVMQSVYGSAEGHFKVGLRFIDLEASAVVAIAGFMS